MPSDDHTTRSVLPGFAEFCERLRIPVAIHAAATEAVNRAKDAVTELLATESATGPAPLVRYAEALRTLPAERMEEAGATLFRAAQVECPLGEVRSYLVTAGAVARASLAPLATQLAPAVFEAFAEAVVANPFDVPTGHEPMQAALQECLGRHLARPSAMFQHLPARERLAAFCASLGIAPEHALRVGDVLDVLKRNGTALIARQNDAGVPPLLRYVAVYELGAPDPHAAAVAALQQAIETEKPEGSANTYEEHLFGLVRECVAPLAPCIGVPETRALIGAVYFDPFGTPTLHDPRTAVLQLLSRAADTPEVPELADWCDAAECVALDRALVRGALATMLTQPNTDPAMPALLPHAEIVASLADVLAPAVHAALVAELAAWEAGANTESLALGRALRAQSSALLAQMAEGLAHHEHHPSRVQGRFCPSPFEYAQVAPDGKVFACCPAMLGAPIGDLRFMDIREAWNSETAVRIRESILDGSFRYCDGARCGFIKDGILAKSEQLREVEHQRIVREGVTRFPEGPKTVNMSYDRTCNLGCPSCRSERIALRGASFRAAERIQQNLLGAHLASVRRLIITGSGDPFASRLFLGFLRGFDPATQPRLRIQISTNGVLLTPEMWASICHEAVDMIDVSIDAATPQTYALNRGGDFTRLVENLHFMGGLLRSGAIQRFWIHFVVQANNYQELAAFVALGRSAGASKICFKELQDWGTYPEGDYARRAVHLPEHPEHAEFLRVLNDPALHAPDVMLFDMGDLLNVQAFG
jgi:hypothetical protein